MKNPNSEDDFSGEYYSQAAESPRKRELAFNLAEKKSKGLGKQTARATIAASNPPLGKRLYPLKEAAQYLGRSEWGMRSLVRAGKIPVVREVRKIYLDIHDLNEYLNRNKALYN